jgi:hypothetical protein
MFAKFASARQLGAAKLFDRVLWRLRMLIRIISFRVSHFRLRTERAKPYGATSLVPKYSFLPSPLTIETLIRSKAIGKRDESRIVNQTELILRDIIAVRGIGEVRLHRQPDNWYDLAGSSAPISAAGSAMINRHDFLLPLVQSAVMSGSTASSVKIAELFRYWIENFRISKLLRHDTPIDAAIRLINWFWVFHYGLLQLQPRERTKLLEVIRVQLDYVAAWRSLGGNHLVLEALSNYLIYKAFPDIPGSGRGVRWSKDTLIDELRLQTTEDGVHTERSSFYHHAVSTHFLKFILVARAADDALPAWAIDRVGRMLDYAHDTTKPNLTHPVLGDGEPMVTDDREHWESRSLPVARSKLFGRPVCANFISGLNDSSIWILGVDPANILTTVELPPSRVFEKSGAAVFRDTTRYLYFDSGPFGHPDLPHHGHADALSIEFSINEADIFVDPGGYGYYDDEFRRFFRSTSAHNTVVIDGRSQSDLYGVFGYGKLANASLDAHDLNKEFDYVAGSHDGYLPIQHHREIFFRKGSMPYLLIIDHLIGKGEHDGAALYHLSSDFSIDDSFNITDSDGKRTLCTAIASNVAVSRQAIKGRKEPSYQGWVSPQTGVAVPAYALELSFQLRDRVFIAVLIAEHRVIDNVTYSESQSFLQIIGCKTDTYKYTYSKAPSTVLETD